MKKIVTLILISILLSIGLLCGCTEQNTSQADDEARFVGTWGAYSENFQTTFSMTFSSDGTFTHGPMVFDWQIKDGKLFLLDEDGKEQSSYNYYFTENDTKLHLQTVGTDVYVTYTKEVQ